MADAFITRRGGGGGGKSLFAKIVDKTITEVTAEDLNSVTSIGNGAFADCSGLTFVMFSNSVTSIGSSAFSGCTGLTSITIPDSVTSIGNWAFSGCIKLSSVKMLPTTPPTLGGNQVFNNTAADLQIVVPKGTLDAYKTAANWSTYASKMVEVSE